MNEVKAELIQKCSRLTNEYIEKNLATFKGTKVEHSILDWAYNNAPIEQLKAWKKDYQTMLKGE